MIETLGLGSARASEQFFCPRSARPKTESGPGEPVSGPRVRIRRGERERLAGCRKKRPALPDVVRTGRCGTNLLIDVTLASNAIAFVWRTLQSLKQAQAVLDQRASRIKSIPRA